MYLENTAHYREQKTKEAEANELKKIEELKNKDSAKYEYQLEDFKEKSRTR